MTKDQPTDSELWGQIRLDNYKAFDKLFSRYWSAVYTTSFIYLKDAEACTELVHDIFINIWRNRHHLEISSFKSYLTMASRYQVYKLVKKAKTNPIVLIMIRTAAADIQLMVGLSLYTLSLSIAVSFFNLLYKISCI